jgi:hypothetical protein
MEPPKNQKTTASTIKKPSSSMPKKGVTVVKK